MTKKASAYLWASIIVLVAGIGLTNPTKLVWEIDPSQHQHSLIGLLLLLIAPLLICLFFSNLRGTPDNNKIHSTIWICITALSGTFGTVFVYDGTNKLPMVAMLAATAATIGWIAQRQGSINISRKQHTLTILLQFRQSELFNRHRTNMFSYYPDGIDITPAEAVKLLDQRKNSDLYSVELNGEQTYPVIESIYYICNFFEFLAAGVRMGDLDGDLLNETIGGIMRSVYKKSDEILKIDQKIDANGKPTTKTFDNFYWLIKEEWA